MFWLLTKYSDERMKEDSLARVGRRERHRFECLGSDGRIILKCVMKELDGVVEWIYLALDRIK